MPKIGIVTYHFSDNFGAVLQAYALRAWLLQQGYDAEFVNYCPDYVENGGDFAVGVSRKVLRANIKIAYLKACALRNRLLGNRAQHEAFARFRREYLGVTGPALKTLTELRQMPANYDVLICGSDQIWNPSVQRGLDPAYFLRFGNPDARRISFAASFGNASVQLLREAGAAELLSGLGAISTREDSGVRHVHDLIGRSAQCVLDPTFLLDGYENLISTEAGSISAYARSYSYIFTYALRTDAGVREIATSVSDLMNLPIVSPQTAHQRWRPIGTPVLPGPMEWVSLVAKSSFVVTNSFHGTVFSILMRRPFVVAGLPGVKQGLNDRMLTLLRKAGLERRMVAGSGPSVLEAIFREGIDWPAVEEKLRGWRAASRDYLTTQIASARN